MDHKVDTESLSKLRAKAEFKLVVTQEEVNWMVGIVTRERDIAGRIADLKAFVSRQQVAKPPCQSTEDIVGPRPFLVSLTSMERMS
jgi:hypothetical protein